MPRSDSSAKPMDAMTRNTAPRAMHSAAPTRCIKCPEATTATRVLVMATAKTCPASRSVPPGRTPAARPGKWRHKKWTEGNWLRKTGRIDWRACRWRAVASEFSHALNRPFCSTATWGDSHLGGGVKVRKSTPFALPAYHLGAIAPIVIFSDGRNHKTPGFLGKPGVLCVSNVAVKERFELSIQFPVYTLSRRAP